jgi:hypothetical protein
MKDYHVEQFAEPRTSCSSKDCACATTAMGIYFGTRGSAVMTAHDVRHFSGISCVPGVDTPSGGINIPAIERVYAMKGADIDFGNYKRWSSAEVKSRLSSIYGGHLMGMYSSVKAPWRAHGSTFQGGHSLWAHDLREDLPDSHDDKVQATVCWHDPLRPRPIRVPLAVVIAYTQTSSALKGYVGWVRIPAVPGGVYAHPMTDRTRTAYPTVAVHQARTTGAASTVRVIRGEGKLVEVAMYAPGAKYKGSTRWCALSLLGDEWVHEKRLDHVGGPT